MVMLFVKYVCCWCEVREGYCSHPRNLASKLQSAGDENKVVRSQNL